MSTTIAAPTVTPNTPKPSLRTTRRVPDYSVGALTLKPYHSQAALPCEGECDRSSHGGWRGATHIVLMAGHPAGYLCTDCARRWRDRWRKFAVRAMAGQGESEDKGSQAKASAASSARAHSSRRSVKRGDGHGKPRQAKTQATVTSRAAASASSANRRRASGKRGASKARPERAREAVSA